MRSLIIILKITDEGLINLSTNNPGIEALNLNYCSRLSDTGLTTAIDKMPRLKKIELHVNDF